MNSLQELNGYVQALSFEYTDLRGADVIFNLDSPINQTLAVDEGFPFLSSVGIEITEILSYASSNPTYTINVSNLTGTTVSWSGLQSYMTVINPDPGVYILSGIRSVSDWNLVKQATITTPANYFGVFTYTATISYFKASAGAQSKSWTNTITVNDVTFLTNPAEVVYLKNDTTVLTSYPQIINLDVSYPGAQWTITITPNTIVSIVDIYTSVSTGGTFTVNPSTKVVTIVGTRAQVNGRLSGLTFDSNEVPTDVSLTYLLSNNANSATDTKVQILRNSDLQRLGNVTVSTIYFAEDSDGVALTGAPLVTDSEYDGLGNYDYTIAPSNPGAILSFTVSGTGGTTSFNETTHALLIVGTRAEINSRLANIIVVPGIDWSDSFSVNYTVLTPREDTVTKLQSWACNTSDGEISNMALTRTYTANNANNLFTENTPQIVDLDTNPLAVYTIIFSSAPGQWSFSNTVQPVNTLTFSGTRAQCNEKLALVKFYPNAGVSTNSTFNYQQLKDGVSQINQTVSLTGQAGSYTRRFVFFAASQTWVPNNEDVKYAKIEHLLVAGGGSAGQNGGIYSSGFPAGYSYGGTGGGGGGVIYSTTPQTLAYTSYPVTIGAGGQSNGASGTSSTGFGITAPGSNGSTSGLEVKNYDVVNDVFFADRAGFAGGALVNTTGTYTGNAGGGGGHNNLFLTGTGTGNAATQGPGDPGRNGGGGGQGGPGFAGILAASYDYLAQYPDRLETTQTENNGAVNFWQIGAGGGGGGQIVGGAGGTSTSPNIYGAGANQGEDAKPGIRPSGTYPANTASGGGGGFGTKPGARGGDGVIIIVIAAQ